MIYTPELIAYAKETSDLMNSLSDRDLAQVANIKRVKSRKLLIAGLLVQEFGDEILNKGVIRFDAGDFQR